MLSVINCLKKHSIFIIFVSFYVLVNATAYLLNGMKYPDNSYFTFLTAWFNLSEDFSNIYSNFYIGFLYNFFVPLSIILTWEFLYPKLYVKDKNYIFPLKYSFFIGVFATYICTILIWIYDHIIATGSSILAFTLILLLLLYLCAELLYITKTEFRKDQSNMLYNSKIYIIFLIVLIILLAYYAYILFINNNPDWHLHILGIVISTILYCFILPIKLLINHRMKVNSEIIG